MTRETFKLIDAVQCESIDAWGVVENVNSSDYFGTHESVELKGQFLFIYKEKDDYYCFIDKFTPTHVFEMEGNETLNLYKID